MDKRFRSTLFTLACLAVGSTLPALAAQSGAGGNAAEMARKMQDPLANIKALMTDNDILFKTGEDKTSYSFQLQPVKAWSLDEQGMNFIARGIIPILGAAPASSIPPAIGFPGVSSDGRLWGLGDIVTQFFFSPKTEDPWKWGLGPIVSWKTRGEDELGGAGWGAGPVGVLVGSLTPNVASSFIVGHLWGDGGDFSTSTLQPMIFYNFPDTPGVALAYNATISYDWKASSENRWTVPVGATLSKMFDLGGGYGLEAMAGAYWNAEKPNGAADWRINWAINVLLP